MTDLADNIERGEHPCDAHTPQPEGYIQWHAWAKEMSKTHKQRRCVGCGLYQIWEPKSALVRAVQGETR